MAPENSDEAIGEASSWGSSRIPTVIAANSYDADQQSRGNQISDLENLGRARYAVRLLWEGALLEPLMMVIVASSN